VTEPLFEMEASDPAREHQACDICLTGAWASNDALRVRGWAVYDGQSLTGKPLKARICPACRRAPKEKS
jgi:hypothetical protein